MYALSWLFLAVAVGSLAFGLSEEGLSSIYVSIGASVAAMVFLVASVFRARARTGRAGGSSPPKSPDGASTTPPTAEVMALPRRGTYHRPSCRFVKGRQDTEPMSRDAAAERAYRPCGTCKPG